MAEQSRNWIVIGSSPSATEMLPVARERWPDATTITCNAGIDLFGDGDWPTYYLLWDHVAVPRYAAVAREAQRAGTVLVTADRPWNTPSRCPHTEGFDVRLNLRRDTLALRYERGNYDQVGYSGLMAIMFALNHSAESVALVGMEGFRCNKGGVLDHIDGRPGRVRGALHTRRYIRPYMQSCIDECPHVPFTFFGRPRFQLQGDNLTFISEAG